MFVLKYSTRFKKDLKHFKREGALLSELEKVLDLLIAGQPLPRRYRNHPLGGEFRGCFECHVCPDILLIYKKNKKEITILLLRLGSHSNIF
jgi:mRNA interferase YafQ